jgi:hypothetical protein
MKNILAVTMIVSACLIVPKLSQSEQISHTIRCESEEFSPRNCELPVAPRSAEIKEIRKTRQLSSKPCIEGKSWVANESGITVSNGCRAEFMVIYRISDHSDRRERWHQQSDSNRRQEGSDDGYRDSPPEYAEDPTDIVLRSFEDVLDRRPSKEEVRFYRGLIVDRGWTERQIRNDLRNRKRSGNRY